LTTTAPDDDAFSTFHQIRDTTRKGIEPLVQELFQKYWTEQVANRRNELENDLRNALNAIANRIDSGYNIDVRAKAPSAPADDPKLTQDIETIQGATPELQFLKLEGPSILQLPESTAIQDPLAESKDASGGQDKKKGKK